MSKKLVFNPVSGTLDFIQNTSPLEVDSIEFNTSYTPTGSEPVGTLNWDSTDGTLSLKTTANTNLNIGQETRYYGKASGNITNGQVVQFAGSQGDHVLFKVAVPAEVIANPKLLMGIATEDIANGSFGNVTMFGYVTMNTTGWSQNDLLYFDNVTGQLTNVMPNAPDRCVLIAAVIKEETSPAAANGRLLVRLTWGVKFTELEDVNGTPLTADGQIAVWDNTNEYFDFNYNINDYATTSSVNAVYTATREPTGFNAQDLTLNGDISFVDATRTFNIDKQAGKDYFSFWYRGTEYQKTSAVTKQISDVDGVHVIYFDGNGDIQEMVNPTSGQVAMGILNYIFVSILYWNSTLQEAIYVGEERHKVQMDSSTHAYLHFTEGMRYLNGLGLTDFSVDGTGAVIDVQFGVSDGNVADEDIDIDIDAIVSTTGLPVYYMLGADGVFYREVNAGYSAVTEDSTSSTNIAYNQYTGGAWQKTAVSNNNYCLYHIFATSEKDKPIIAIMGQAVYSNITQARTGANVELLSIITNETLTPEIRPLGTVIYQANSSYVNDINARIRTTDDGENYIDWRSESISRVSLTTSDHNALSNLQGGTAGQYYHLTSAEITVVQNTSGTNTGDQVLPTRDSLGLDTDDTVTFANLSGTNTGDQDTFKITGQTVNGSVDVNDLVIWDQDNSEWRRTTAAETPAGILTASTEVTFVGIVSGFTGLTTGEFYYQDSSGGYGITTAKDTFIKVGTAISSTEIYFQVSAEYTRYSDLTKPYALFSGGFSTNNVIHYVIITTLSNSTDWGQLTEATYGHGGAGNKTYGLFAGGYVDKNVMNYITFSTMDNAVDFGDLSVGRQDVACACNETRLITSCGYINGSAAYSNVMDYVTIATTGDATDFGDATTERREVAAASSPTRMVTMGGNTGSASNIIDYVTISTAGNATDFGDLNGGRYRFGATAGTTRAICAGGSTPADANWISYFTIASTGNASDFGDLSATRSRTSMAGSLTRAIECAGLSGAANVNVIEYVEISTTSNAIDFGDLRFTVRAMAGLSNCHGGLQ